MKALANYIVNLCLLRSAPQDLPASLVLLLLSLVLNIALGTVMVMDSEVAFKKALAESLFEVLLMLLALYVALFVYEKRARFQQSATALLGVNLLFGMLALPLVMWNHATGSTEAGLLLLIVVFWSIVAAGHIIRHTFEVSLNIGIAASLLFTLVAWNLASMFFSLVE